MPSFIPPKACHSCRDSPGMAQINPCQLGKVTQIHVSRNMETTEHLLVVWAQCYVWCVLSVLFSGRMLIKRGGMFVPRPGYCLSGMAISQGSTGKCSWPTCQMGSPKHPVRRKVCVEYVYICWIKIDIASILTSLCLWQTLWRRVRLYCWCWSGVVSWRQRVEFRLRSLDEPFVACTLEDKV